MQPENDTRELLDRTRRIETRLVSLIEHLGVEPDRKMPLFALKGDKGVITVPSIRTSLDDIMKAVPANWPVTKWIEVVHKGKAIAIVYRPDE